MFNGNFYNTTDKALPSSGIELSDSLDLQIVEDPVNQAFIAKDQEEMQNQIDAFTAMMKDNSAPSTTKQNRERNKPYARKESQVQKTSSEEENWEKKFVLENDRYLTICKFRSSYRIHIRDFFQDNAGVTRPTKRGISLTVAQWQKLQLLAQNVNEALHGQDMQ